MRPRGRKIINPRVSRSLPDCTWFTWLARARKLIRHIHIYGKPDYGHHAYVLITLRRKIDAKNCRGKRPENLLRLRNYFRLCFAAFFLIFDVETSSEIELNFGANLEVIEGLRRTGFDWYIFRDRKDVGELSRRSKDDARAALTNTSNREPQLH